MIIFGSHELLPYIEGSNKFKIENLSSYTMKYGRSIPDIVPPITVQYIDKNFDIMYANYLLSNAVFFRLFERIIFPGICEGIDLYILVHRDEGNVFDTLTESLQKFIQQRYGINTFLVNTKEDIDTLLNGNDMISEVTREPIHIENIDLDMNRYINTAASCL